jgi:hypothetical protein
VTRGVRSLGTGTLLLVTMLKPPAIPQGGRWAGPGRPRSRARVHRWEAHLDRYQRARGPTQRIDHSERLVQQDGQFWDGRERTLEEQGVDGWAAGDG